MCNSIKWVRLILLFIIGVYGTFASLLYAQSGESFFLEGTYSGYNIAADVPYAFTFNEDGTFDYVSYQHLGIQRLGKGTFKVNGKRLTLNYEKKEIPNKSFFKIISRKKSESSTKITIEVYDLDEFKMGSFIRYYKEGKQNNWTLGDGEDLTIGFDEESDVDQIGIDWLGYKELLINLDTIKNEFVSLKAYLEVADKTAIKPKNETFILELKGGELLLKKNNTVRPVYRISKKN